MSTQISMTLPDKIVEALGRKGKFYDLTAAEVVKQNIIMSAHGCDVALGLGTIIQELQQEAAEKPEASGQRSDKVEAAPLFAAGGAQARPGSVNDSTRYSAHNKPDLSGLGEPRSL